MYIGIDLGGTKIAAGLVTKHGELRQIFKIPTKAILGKEHIILQLRDMITRLSAGRDIQGIGIGVPGVIDGNKIVYLTNIPSLNNTDMKKALKLRLPFVMENDAACFTRAEHIHGAGKGSKHMIGITLGTGLGSGIIIENKLHKGQHGYAGETSYAIYNQESVLRNAKPVNWEKAVLGGKAIQERNAKNGGAPLYPLEVWSVDNTATKKTRAQVSKLFAVFLANLSVTIDPEVIVVGGGWANKKLLQATKKHLGTYLEMQGKLPDLRLAKCKEPGILGAVEALKGKLSS